MCYTLSVTFTILLISLRHLESVKLKILKYKIENFFPGLGTLLQLLENQVQL